jgi:multisubunit Na+/H+ antiporter MnhE subunit
VRARGTAGQAGHRCQLAVATVLLSTAPGSVVVDVQDHRLLVHELTGTGLDETVRK